MELWAIARYDLRLDEAEFWQLTPRQFVALQRRREEHYERLSMTGLAGIASGLTGGLNAGKKSNGQIQPKTIEDAAPSVGLMPLLNRCLVPYRVILNPAVQLPVRFILTTIILE